LTQKRTVVVRVLFVLLQSSIYAPVLLGVHREPCLILQSSTSEKRERGRERGRDREREREGKKAK
jgi:hypothetical protein